MGFIFVETQVTVNFTLVETHQKSWFHLCGDPSKGVDFALVEIHQNQKNGFHLTEDLSIGVGFILMETQVMNWV